MPMRRNSSRGWRARGMAASLVTSHSERASRSMWIRLNGCLLGFAAAACSSGGGDASVLVRSRLVNESGVGIPGLSMMVVPEAHQPGLTSAAYLAHGTSDAKAWFMASSVSTDDMHGARVGQPMNFRVVVFGNDTGTWTCSFVRTPKALPEGGVVRWDGALPSLVLRSDGSCAG